MKYLQYIEDGIQKRFPLEKEETLLGRDSHCDLLLPYDFISQRHALLKLCGDSARIKDLESKNGVWMGQNRVKSGTILLNHSFRIGHLEFFFCDGETEDFRLSPEVKIQMHITPQEDSPGEETRQSLNVFKETVIDMLQVESEDLILDILFETTQVPLKKIFPRGSMILAEKRGESAVLIASQVFSGDFPPSFPDFLESGDLWRQQGVSRQLPGGWCVNSVPLSLPRRQLALFYVVDHRKEISKKNRNFLELMGSELSRLFQRGK